MEESKGFIGIRSTFTYDGEEYGDGEALVLPVTSIGTAGMYTAGSRGICMDELGWEGDTYGKDEEVTEV